MNARNLLWLCLWPSSCLAAEIPQPVLPNGVGVNIHFTRGHTQDLDLIAAAGFKFIRMDFSWGGTERRKGEYNWADYDELTANLEKRGLRAIYILDYSNGLYEDIITSRNPVSGREQRDTASPRKPESIAAFARWSGAAAAHFKGRGIIWEIWNEPNIGFWKPQPNVTNYAALVLATCRAVRATDPQATIVAPAASGFPWAFFEGLFKAGALEHLDGVSVHPYRGYSQGPETAVEDYRRLRALIERHAAPGRKHLPILSGEWGYATQAKGGVSLETQAAFIVRQQLANLYHGVPLSIWYDWKNDGPDPNYNEHNFGTVTLDLQPKPSYRAVQTLTHQLAGQRIARRLDAGTPDHWVLLCVNSTGGQKLVAWTTGASGETTLALPSLVPGMVSAVDGRGQAIAPKVETGKLHLALEAAPQYITLKTPLKELAAAAAWGIGAEVNTLATAGEPDGIQLPVWARNPTGQRALARFRLEGVPGQPPMEIEVPLPPGQSAARTFSATVHRRLPQQFEATVRAELLAEEPEGRFVPLGKWSEDRAFVISNPLDLQLAPIESGWRAQVSSPARAAFAGTLRAGAQEHPLRLTPGRPDATLNLVLDAGGTTGWSILDEATRPVADFTPPRFRPLALRQLRAALDGDAKIPAQAGIVETNAPGGAERPFAKAFRLDYQFDAGWRFVRCLAAEPPSAAVEGRPAAFGLWVHGDGSGNVLRMRVTDAQGQTFQPNGPDVDWTGWRWVTFDLSDLKRAGHWGGANDGVARGDLRLDCPLLVDGARHKTSGTIYLAGMNWMYR